MEKHLVFLEICRNGFYISQFINENKHGQNRSDKSEMLLNLYCRSTSYTKEIAKHSHFQIQSYADRVFSDSDLPTLGSIHHDELERI